MVEAEALLEREISCSQCIEGLQWKKKYNNLIL